MTPNPLISIITVSYNAVKTIEKTIESLIWQSYSNYEFIIIDGGSTDGTCKIITKYLSNISYYSSAPDTGIYNAMNKAIEVAKGDFLYFIGADDVLFNCDSLKKVSVFLSDPSKIYYGDVKFKKRNVIYDGKFNAYKLVTRNICHQGIFYPKNVFCEYKFNEKYKVYSDYELNLKLYNHSKFSFVYIPVIVALFNDEGTSGLNALDNNFESDRISIIRKNFPFWVYFYRIIRTKAVNLLK
jgi:glycosyltransferase involved in cell wall biosynthesis